MSDDDTSEREPALYDSADVDSASHDGSSAACEVAALELQQLFVASLDAPATLGSSQRDCSGAAKSGKHGAIASIAYDAESQRLLLGLEDGQILHWHVAAATGAGSLQHLGRHAGTVGCIATLHRAAPATALVVTGSADATIKLWDCQGHSMKRPAVCIQTLHGHDGTVSALAVVMDSCIVSGGKDRCIRLWRSAAALRFLDHPRFEQQEVVATTSGWIRGICYKRPNRVGVLGSVYAADDQGSIVRLALSTAAAGPQKGLVEFKVEGTDSGRGHSKLAFPRLHDRTITRLLHVPEHQLLLTLSFDACLRAHDALSGALKYAWRNESGCWFTGLGYDMAHSQVLAVDAGGHLAVYSMDSGLLVAHQQLTTEPIVDLSPCLDQPDTYAAVTGSGLEVWKLHRSLEYNIMRDGHTKPVVALHACSGNSQGGLPGCEPDYRMFTASLDNTMRVWDPYDMACLNVLPGGTSEISAMLFFESWNLLVTGHDNGDVRLWNVDTGSCTTTLRGHSNTVTCLCIAFHSQQEELLLSAGYDGAVCVWEARTMRGSRPHLLARFEAHGMDAASLLASADEDGADAQQKRKHGRRSCSESIAGVAAARAVPAANAAGAADKPRSPAGKLVSVSAKPVRSGAVDKLMAVHASSGAAKAADPTPPGTSSSPAAMRDAHTSAGSVDSHGLAAVYKGSVLTAQDLLAAPSPEIMCMHFDAARRIIFTGSNDNSVRVWSGMSYELLGQHLLGHTGAVTCMALDANILFTGSDDGRVCMWDAVPAARNPSLPGDFHAGPQSAFFTTAPLHMLGQHSACVTALVLLPQQGLLASCGRDGRLLFWDYVEGTVVSQQTHAIEAFNCMALRHDLEELLVGTMSGRILRYHLPDVVATVH